MRSHWIEAFTIVACLAPAAAVGNPATRAPSPTLEIVARFKFPASLSDQIADVRWASRKSVFLATNRNGIVEVELREGLPTVRSVLSRESDWPPIFLMATSKNWVLMADPGAVMAWAPNEPGAINDHAHVKRSDGLFHDADVRGDQLVVLGFKDTDTFGRSKGGLIWRADLSKEADSWEVLYENPAISGNYNVFLNNLPASGSIRFLQKGDFVVAPNFIPGVMRFSSAGKLLQTWKSEEIWGESYRASKSEKAPVRPEAFREFLTGRQTVEEVLPLPEGPAIVTREPTANGVRWRLGILGADIEWYQLPTHVSAVAHLRGDVDDKGNIVLVGSARELYESARVNNNELLILRVPLTNDVAGGERP